MIDDLYDIANKAGVNLDDFWQPNTMCLIQDPFQRPWTTVCSHSDDACPDPSIFSCLADTRLESTILDDTDWIKNAGSFSPYFYRSGDETTFTNGQDDGFYYLVAEQHFHSRRESQFIINPEFVMLFELYKDNEGNYNSVDECGDLEKVIDIGHNNVRIRTNYLMRYIAARQLLYVQFVDGRISSSEHCPMSLEFIHREGDCADTYRFDIFFHSSRNHDYLLSSVSARSIVKPGSINSSGVWPFNSLNSEYYPEFIVRENPVGSFYRFACNPSKLANGYDGKNSGAPFYLTPVFFKPDVLDKYRKSPFFNVTERFLRCGTKWEIEIDNVIPDRVMVYLGDLGKKLPEAERKHFLQYEISPEGQSISEEVFRNDFLNMPVEPTGPISSFLDARRQLNVAWENRFGAPLYRKPHPDENDMVKLIRIPSGNGREEFDTVILNLTKLCIDYIDESQLQDTGEKGSINKLCTFLSNNGIDFDASSFRDLQSIRSANMAHAKGRNYEKLKGDIITDDKPADIKRIIGRLTDTMRAMMQALQD